MIMNGGLSESAERDLIASVSNNESVSSIESINKTYSNGVILLGIVMIIAILLSLLLPSMNISISTYTVYTIISLTLCINAMIMIAIAQRLTFRLATPSD
jgi:uncharacterized membrane protein HdeD (DUF308 family)